MKIFTDRLPLSDESMAQLSKIKQAELDFYRVRSGQTIARIGDHVVTLVTNKNSNGLSYSLMIELPGKLITTGKKYANKVYIKI